MKFKQIIIIIFFLSVKIVAQQNNSVKELYKIYEKNCNNYIKKGQLDSTLIYLNKIDSLIIKINDSSYHYKTELLKGSYLIRKGEYEVAMKKLLNATHFFKLQQDSTNYYTGKYKMGVCNYYVNRREDAKQLMKEVLLHKEHVDEQVKINILSNLGAINIELGMINKNDSLIKKSIALLEQAIQLNRKNKKYGYLSSNFSLLAEAYNQLGNKDKALLLLDSALEYAEKTDNISSKGFALIKKSNILTVKRKFKKALTYINKALEIYQNGDDIPTLIYAYVEKKKLLVAMESYKLANQVSDSIYGYSIKNYDKRFADGISEMTVKYKTAEKEREILTQRADIAEKGLLLQKKNYQIYGFIGLAVLMAIIGYFFYKQQELKNKQLVKENQLKAALQEIETQNKLQEQRLRISRDLHDNIGAQLSFIISSIDNLKFLTKESNPNLKDKLTYISTFTTTTIHQLRDTIWAMNKNQITIKDLHSRILTFIENAKKATNDINIQFKMNVTSEISFTSIKGINIFRVVQEAINNAVKYANASQINVEMNEKENQLILSVTDNGDGFDINTVELGNGLKNMQDRIDEVGGVFLIDSSEKGTIIKVTCDKKETNKV